MIRLTDKEIEACVSEFCSYLEGHRQALNEVAKAQLKKVVEWLQAHCQGYHRGYTDREFGHFGIYRDEIEALLEEVKGWLK